MDDERIREYIEQQRNKPEPPKPKKLYVDYYGPGENGDDGESEVLSDVAGITVSLPDWVAVQDSKGDVTYIKSETIKRMRLEADFLQGL